MARVTVREPVAGTVVGRRLPPVWRLVPLAFYLFAFALIRGDLTRLPGAAAGLSLRLYFAAMVLYVGGMFSYFAFFAYRQQALRWLGVALVAPGALIHLGAIFARGVADSHYPLANMYEYSSMLSLVAGSGLLLRSPRAS